MSLDFMKNMAIGMNWICSSPGTNCMCHIFQVVGGEIKISTQHTSTLAWTQSFNQAFGMQLNLEMFFCITFAHLSSNHE